MATKMIITPAVGGIQFKEVEVSQPLAVGEQEVHTSSNKDIPVGQAANSFVVAVKAQHIGTALPTSNVVGGVTIGLNEDIYFQDTVNDVNSGIYEVNSLAPLTWGRAEYSLHPAFRENYKILLVGEGSGTKVYKMPYIPGYNTGLSFGATKVADTQKESERKFELTGYIDKGTLNEYKGEAANDTQILSLGLTGGEKIKLDKLYIGNLNASKGGGVTYIGEGSPTSINVSDFKDNGLKDNEPYLLEHGIGWALFQHKGNVNAPLKISSTGTDGATTYDVPLTYTKTSNFQQGTKDTPMSGADILTLQASLVGNETATATTINGKKAMINSTQIIDVATGEVVNESGAVAAPAFSNTKQLRLTGIDDFLDYGDILNNVFSGPTPSTAKFSMSQFIKQDLWGSPRYPLFAKGKFNTANQEFVIFIHEGKFIRINYGEQSGGFVRIDSAIMPLVNGSKHHLLITFDATGIIAGPGVGFTTQTVVKFYLDGVEIPTNMSAGVSTNSLSRINIIAGGQLLFGNQDGTDFANGNTDEIAIASGIKLSSDFATGTTPKDLTGMPGLALWTRFEAEALGVISGTDVIKDEILGTIVDAPTGAEIVAV